MTKKEFAEKLNGRQYAPYPQFLPSEIQTAKENGFVIVYGASDDLMEFDGAIIDEGGCFDGGEVYFDKNGVSQDGTERANMIEALWCEGTNVDGCQATWSYKTDIPHETFEIWEDEELYCIGLVFSIEDIK